MLEVEFSLRYRLWGDDVSLKVLLDCFGCTNLEVILDLSACIALRVDTQDTHSVQPFNVASIRHDVRLSAGVLRDGRGGGKWMEGIRN